MKTTLELPDELMREVKIRAAEQNRRLKDVIADLLRRGLGDRSSGQPPHRVRLPLIECRHDRAPGDELTPERIAQILIDDEAANVFGG
jgi:hypothetical protein